MLKSYLCLDGMGIRQGMVLYVVTVIGDVRPGGRIPSSVPLSDNLLYYAIPSKRFLKANAEISPW
jgi:hypothetical protein